MKFRLLIITVIVFFVFGIWILPGEAQKSVGVGGGGKGGNQKMVPKFSNAVNFAVSPPVRSFPQRHISPSPDEEGTEINELNDEIERTPVAGAELRTHDAALHSQPNAPNVIPGPTLTFEGLADVDNLGLVNPSDSNADVGPNHIVETVNNRVRIYNKTGTPLTPPFLMSDVFAPLGGICALINDGDPVVLYDRIADRWLLSQFAFTATNTPPYHECVAISKNGDPTGEYFLYDFIVDGNNFPDYPHLGVWPDGYYMSTREFFLGGGFVGVGAVAFDRAKMLVGDPTAGIIQFQNGDFSDSSSGMLPSDHDGLLPPPAGAPNVFAIYTSATFGDPEGDAVRLFNFHADWVTPANSTFLERSESPITVAAFDPRNPNGRTDIEQPAPSVAADRLDSIGDRLMHRVQYFNRGGVESLVTTHTVNVSGGAGTTAATHQAGIRYYEFRKSTPGGMYAVYDQATFSPDAGNGSTGTNRWMGSAAIDNQGNLAVAYSASSTTLFPSIRYAGRAFNETGGLLQGEATMFAGLGSQQASGNRWGDYTSTMIDPSDDCTFWHTNEYYPAGLTQFNWHTRIGAFKFTSCTTPAQGTLAGTITACASGAPISDAMIQVSGGPSNGYSSATIANGTYSMKLAPGSYTATISSIPRSCAPAGPFNVTITDGQTTTLNACLDGVGDMGYVSSAVSGGNGNGVIDRNECNNLNVTIENIGCAPATNVSATLSTSTPGVTITQPNSPYPNMAIDATATNTVPFSVSTSPGFMCGTPIDFTLTVTFGGGSSMVTFSLTTCTCADVVINGSLDSNDLQQDGRMGRNGVASSCLIPKVCPGPIGAGTNRSYDLYSFTNGPTDACVTITLTANCPSATNPIISTAYLNSFVPSNICTNYLGDPGNSPAPTLAFSSTVPAGATLLVNVHEINQGAGCSSYTLTVSGLVCDTDGGGTCGACTITCPSKIVVDNTPGQCGAIVNYPAPTTSGTCGVVTCTPPSSGFFPIGNTVVTCTTTAGNSCKFIVTVKDTQAPQITCPANITAVTPNPNSGGAVVNYATPVATDNCPGVTVTCSPASGTTFPRGVTTVTCTARDTAGNVTTCTFNVTVYDICIEDNTNPANVVLASSTTGDYVFCCGATTVSGTGTVTKKPGGFITITHTTSTKKVTIQVLPPLNVNQPVTGAASLQMPVGTTLCNFKDSNIANNSCNCTAP